MLAEKKRKIQLNLDRSEAMNISDDEYPTIDEQAGGSVDEAQILMKLEGMMNRYYQQTTGKEAPSLPLSKKWKKIPWIQHQAVTSGSIELTAEDIEHDLKRELAFYNVALENSRKAIEKLVKKDVPVWRPPDYKVEMLKNDLQMNKVQTNLKKIKQKIELVEKRKTVKNRKNFSKEAHKKHVKSKQSFKKKKKTGNRDQRKKQRHRRNK